jgi:rhamnose transport system permease protein
MRLENYTVNVINIVTGVLLVLSVISTSFLSWASGLRSRRGGGLGLLRRRPAVAAPPPRTNERYEP